MSMNKYMHPRNIYKTPPNFKELVKLYPEFREFVQQDITGKITLDFKNLKSLRALSCILLKKDFELNVEIPLNKLIPTIPLRLNYILWVEDLIEACGRKEHIRGIDIGTGASCIYPLLAAKKNNWEMYATEIDKESIETARKNIKINNLENLITVVEINNDTLIENIVQEQEFDFCMCNPPFFSSTEELHPFFKARTKNRPHPKNAFCATVHEVVSKGGEVEFITKLIKESSEILNKIKLYTTMVGHKSSIPPLKKLLRETGVSSFKETEFCQGNTTRWGLAWTFESLDLRKVADLVKTTKTDKPKPSLLYQIPLSEVNELSLVYVNNKIMQLFKELQFVCEEVSRNKNILRFFVKAFSNTWSNQRRKRRAQQRLNSSNEMEVSTGDITQNNNIPECKSPGKRERGENLDGSLIKKLKINSESKSFEIFFKFMMATKFENNIVSLELNCDTETENRDYLYQILQYIKNNLKV